MSLAPQFSGHRLGPVNARNTIEVYLDYVCPYSAKMYKTIRKQVWPLIQEKYAGSFQILFRHQVQPWHASSTIVHEAALAIEVLDASKFYEFSDLLFEHQERFFDGSVQNKTRQQLVDELSQMAASLSISDAHFKQLIMNGTEGSNEGNKITKDLKLAIRLARQNGIHVSPTVVFNGLQDNEVSSSWDGVEWEMYLKKKY
ncbi:thioredoxin-like protein [Spinellus fusiger]|nr:thioredoxin-like protein [Spinellus fusiger]